MEAILKFNLPEDKYELNTAINGERISLAIQELDQWLRNEIRNNSNISEDTDDAYDKCRSQIREAL